MFFRTILFLIIISIPIYSQNKMEQIILPGKEYGAGTRVQNAYRGVSFIIPRDWKGAMPPDQSVFLMSSKVKPGMGIAIFQSAFSEEQIIQYLSQSQNLGDNIILKPVGKPKVNGSKITMEYTSMTNAGFALALRGKFQQHGDIPVNRTDQTERILSEIIGKNGGNRRIPETKSQKIENSLEECLNRKNA